MTCLLGILMNVPFLNFISVLQIKDPPSGEAVVGGFRSFYHTHFAAANFISIKRYALMCK